MYVCAGAGQPAADDAAEDVPGAAAAGRAGRRAAIPRRHLTRAPPGPAPGPARRRPFRAQRRHHQREHTVVSSGVPNVAHVQRCSRPRGRNELPDQDISV